MGFNMLGQNFWRITYPIVNQVAIYSVLSNPGSQLCGAFGSRWPRLRDARG